jgi:hypothetical protein
MADSGAPDMDQALAGPETQQLETPATPEGLTDLTDINLSDLPDLPDATVVPEATLPAPQDPMPAPEDAAGDTAQTDASEPAVATNPTTSPPAPVVPAFAPTLPGAIPGANDASPEPKGDGARIGLAAKPAAMTGTAQPMPARATPEPTPPSQPEITAAKPPEAAVPLADPAAPAPEIPRPVAVTVSQAPAAQTGQTPAASPSLPILQTQRPDWPLDLAERLIEGASLRSLGTGGLMEIRLDPDTLGPVTLRLEVADGTANVAIVTQTPEAARLFTDNQQRLADALARAGLDLGQHSAGTDARGGQQSRERPDGARTGTGPTDTPQPEAPQRATARDRRVDLIA